MDPHRLAEERSVAYHGAIAERLRREPEVLERARRRVEGWLVTQAEAPFYARKWAEVLAADAFSAFEETGVFDGTTAQRFLDAILTRGGSRDALEAFIEFRGRAPDVRALLKQHGIDA